MSSTVLGNRDTNQIMQNENNANPFMQKQTESDKPKSMDYHRQMMEKKLKESKGEETPSYVSPSDAIMSPASQKLNSYKQRQISKGPNPVKRSLFQSVHDKKKDLASGEGQQEE